MPTTLLHYAKTHRISILLIAAAVILCLITSIDALFVILSIAILYKLLDSNLKDEGRLSHFAITIIALVSYCFILQTVLIVPWIFHHTFSNTWCIAGLFILLAALFFLSHVSLRTSNRKKVDVFDIAGIGLALGAALVIFLPPLLHREGGVEWAIVSAVGGNVDDGAHLSMFNNRLSVSEGIIENYPAGLHAVSALITKSFVPQITLGVASLTAYVIVKTLWFTLLIYSLVRVAAYFIQPSLRSDRKTLFFASTTLLLSVSVFLYIFLLDIFKLGFFSYTPQLIGIVWMLIFITGLAKANSYRDFTIYLLLSGLFSIGGALSWILLAPPLLLLTGIVAIIKVIHLKHISQIKPFLWIILPAGIVLLGGLFIQIGALSSAPNALSFFQSIILEGAIVTYPLELYGLLFLGIAAFYILISDQQRSAFAFYVLFVLLIFAFALFCLQLVLAGKLSYYYFKVLYACAIAGLPLAVAGITLTALKMFKAMGGHAYPLLLVSVVLAIMLIPGTEDRFSYIEGKRWLSPRDGVTALRALNHQDSRNVVLYYDQSNGVRADIMMLVIQASDTDADCFLKARDIIRHQQDNRGTLPPIIIATEQICNQPVHLFLQPDLVDDAKALIKTNNVTVSAF